jgi:hypothetical protein
MKTPEKYGIQPIPKLLVQERAPHEPVLDKKKKWVKLKEYIIVTCEAMN